ncbi:uncharacterized protein METZ01_LOCUS171860 [marine metagenome]|uniref:Uncharacterized protein n=1 Tax=marine metagenome TaxID=408172 RepID=A0A382BYX7_9ZZZZ
MKQQTEYRIMIVMLLGLLSLFIWDSYNVFSEIHQIKFKLGSMEQKFRSNKNITNEINNFQETYVEKKETIFSSIISDNELENNIDHFRTMAKSLGLQIKGVKTGKHSTFPSLKKQFSENEIPFDRYYLSFQIKGNFLKIGSFMDRVRETSSNLSLGQCSFMLDSYDPRGVIAQIEYLTYLDDGK